MRHCALAAILLLAGCGPSPGVDKARSSSPPAHLETVADLLREEAKADEACRGGSGDDPQTQASCGKRDMLVAKLNRAGMCYGPPDLPMYQQKWGPCVEPRPATTPASATISADQGEPAAQTREALDRVSAIRDGKVQEYMSAADHCMHAKAESSLYAGLTQRSQLVRQTLASCSTTLIAILQSDAGLSADDARTGARAMADRAVDDVLTSYGR